MLESKYGDSLTIRTELKEIFSNELKNIIIFRSESLAKQTVGFANELDEIQGLLAKYDPAPSPTFNAIDQKGQDFAAYYFAAYATTQNIEKSFLVYKTVKSLVRYILLMDRFYEVGNRRYERIARGLLQTIKQTHQQHHLRYSIDFALKQFWPFWDFEQLIKKRLTDGHAFTSTEVRYFNLFKSSDAPIIYARVLDNELPGFNPNVANIIHYNQALEDLQDDFEDIDEDILERMPNAFVLAATEKVSYSKLVGNMAEARRIIIQSGAVESVLSLVDQYSKLIQDITVPPNYTFLKQLSKDYIDRLLKTINAVR